MKRSDAPARAPMAMSRPEHPGADGSQNSTSPLAIRGLMMDCSRLLERHEYYLHLIDLMADWGYNLLVLHFSDDHGCSVKLPGLAYLAVPRAMTPRQVRDLVRHAAMRGIDIVPEIETFGHTRFLTDRPEFAHLRLHPKTNEVRFNAINPLHPDTHRIVRRMIRATARLFPSRYIHVGGDEVAMKDFCAERGLDERKVWADYMARVFKEVHACGRTPLFWSCKPGPDAAENLEGLPREAVAVYWDYSATGSETGIRSLCRAGCQGVLTAPSIACYEYRFLPVEPSLRNVDRMASYARRHQCLGMLTTAWCPNRTLQGSIDFGVAYAGAAALAGGRPDPKEFRRRLAETVLGLPLTAPLDRLLRCFPKLVIEHHMAHLLYARKPWKPELLARIEPINRIWLRFTRDAAGIVPTKGLDTWEGMLLAADCAGLGSEAALLGAETPADRAGPLASRVADYRHRRRALIKRLDANWDRTRFSDDPTKHRPLFANEADQYALQIARRLPLFTDRA